MFIALSLLLLPLQLHGVPPNKKNHWAVLIAGSNGYDNYRHQADVCHAYQILKSNGVPEEQIITLSYNDVVNSSDNPFPGKLFNKPTGDAPGVDVYEGCKVHYSRKDVNAKNLAAVLTGNKSATTNGGPVLQSTKNDYVFIYFADHGADDIIGLPSESVNKVQLRTWLETMERRKMYNKLVFYIEACRSGSMFEGSTPIKNQYYVTAAKPDESSWGTYCDDDTGGDMVNGTDMDTCLGDLFSVNWMEDADHRRILDKDSETLQEQYLLVKNETTKSHVMQYGDLSFTNEPANEFEGSDNRRKLRLLGDHATESGDASEAVMNSFFLYPTTRTLTNVLKEEVLAERERLREIKRVSSIPSRMIPIHLAYRKLKKEEGRPNNYGQQLKAATRLLEAVKDRVNELQRALTE